MESKPPVMTGHNFQIRDIKNIKGSWQVQARLGELQVEIQVRGTLENVLQVLGCLSENPEAAKSLKGRVSLEVKDGQVQGENVNLPAERVSPFALRVLNNNSAG